MIKELLCIVYIAKLQKKVSEFGIISKPYILAVKIKIKLILETLFSGN